MVPELIPFLGSWPAGDVSHKPGGRLPLLSARPAVILAEINGESTSVAWPTLGSRTANEQDRVNRLKELID